jgi:hypothetical protein
LVAYHNVDRQDIIILDRGPFDSLAWMSVLQKRNQLDAEEFTTIASFARHPKWFTLISRINLFTCSPRVSLERELQLKLTLGQGTAMNEEMLTALLGQYEALADAHPDDPLRQFDTSLTPGPLSTALPIAQDIMDLMERPINANG